MHKLVTIDDEPEFVDFIESYFELRGFEVHKAHNGEAGLKVIDRVKPDIVLLDYKMPGMNGAQVLTAIKVMNASLPVIMITASEGLGETRQKLSDIGAYATFDKPISSLKDLENTIKEALNHE
ncbi:MAG: DNA-binding response OmpR family regulator [Candidatus Omnitrophota bacterium]